MAFETAAIVTVGSELVEGLRIDTNTAEIARLLSPLGFSVQETVSVGDDVVLLAELLGRLVVSYKLVVVTGGLGPTHDDITREAAARALNREMHEDSAIAQGLAQIALRHLEPEAARQVLVQAQVIDGAEVMPAVTGTAPGQVLSTGECTLVLLPGPPSEMRPMLAGFLARYPLRRARPRDLGVVGLGESDVQMIVQRALAPYSGVGFTVLASPGDVRAILVDEGAGEGTVGDATSAVCDALGEYCYSDDASTLQGALVHLATGGGVSLGTAESCTGGMIAAAITDVAGASDVFLGSAVVYSNESKSSILGVDESLIAEHGAVSEEVARAMAEGARRVLECDVALSVTGIAGPGGGSAEKPVGLVWFGVATADGTVCTSRYFASRSRAAIRQRATATGLNLLRLEVLKAR